MKLYFVSYGDPRFCRSCGQPRGVVVVEAQSKDEAAQIAGNTPGVEKGWRGYIYPISYGEESARLPFNMLIAPAELTKLGFDHS